MLSHKRQRNTARPWGKASGLLAACFATLIGVACRLEPDVILMRAVVAGVAVGLLTAVVGSVLSALLSESNG